MEPLSIIAQVVLAYIAAVLAPYLAVYIPERRAMIDLKARCDALWVDLNGILDICQKVDSRIVRSILENYAYCREVEAEYNMFSRAYAVGGVLSFLYFVISLDTLIGKLHADSPSPVVGLWDLAIFLFISAILAYIAALIAGMPSGYLRPNVERFAASVSLLARTCSCVEENANN